MIKIAFFRFEASSKIGAGHAIRSSVLADALTEKAWQCKIVTSETSYNFIKDLERFERVDPDSFFEERPSCDLLVIDSYDLGEDYEKHFRDCTKKIMVIDDLANRKHDSDILLDHTYGREAYDYKDLVPEGCKILAGSDYVLLRKEFVELRSKALEKRRATKEIKRLLISMGGSDPENHAVKVLEIVRKSGFSGVIDLALGFSNHNRLLVEKYAQDFLLNVNIHLNPDMGELIYQADLAIGGGGSSMWERSCLGLPTLMVVLADNQFSIAQNLHKSGAAIYLGEINTIDVNDASTILKNLIQDNFQRERLQNNSFQICNGQGISSIIEVINDVH